MEAEKFLVFDQGEPLSQPFQRSILANDPYDQQLVENCHPSHWINPSPKGKYNLVVLGAGTAGLVSAAGAAGLGAEVAHRHNARAVEFG